MADKPWKAKERIVAEYPAQNMRFIWEVWAMENHRKLNRRQRRFVDNCLSGMSWSDAYIAAGYKPRSEYDAIRMAIKLMEDDRIRVEVNRRLKERMTEAQKALKALVDAIPGTRIEGSER